MTSPDRKRPRGRLSLRARRRESSAGRGFGATAPPPRNCGSGAAGERGGSCGPAGRPLSKLSRRLWRARGCGPGAAPGDGPEPDPSPGPEAGERVRDPGPDPSPGPEAGERVRDPGPEPDPSPGPEAGDPGPEAGEALGAAGRDTDPAPYYLANFVTVLAAVLGSEDKELFDEEDRGWIGTFQQLSAAGQKLYVRLFQRKLNWLKVSRLDYAEIGLDLTPTIEELSLAGLLQTGSELCDISEALDLLSAPELKLLAKTFHLQPRGQRAEILGSLLQLGKQKSIFSSDRNPSSPGSAILNRVKELVGRCVKVTAPARAVFSRVLLLFSLTESTDEEEAASAGQSQLSTVLMVNMGHVVFPSYSVLRETKIFRHRDDLLRYDAAVHSLAEVGNAMSNGTWSDALQIYKNAREKWSSLENSSDVRFCRELPVYLRCFTAGWIYTRIRFRGVEVLQRLHMYQEAVEELQSLLEQSIFCPESRGLWWDRLSLNLQQHLKRPDQAIGCVREGLNDAQVQTGHRLALHQRAMRIRDSPSCKKWRHLLQDLPVMGVEDVPHVTVKGRACPGMGNALFLMERTSEGEGESCSTVICSVEEVSLAHYQRQGFDQGIHGEGATFLTLFGLLFWEIIFLPGIPDVFRNPYQACPLDLYTECFYQHRREPIESRLEILQDAPTGTLHTLIANVWNSHKGTAATLVNWEIFSSLQQAQSLVSCLGGLFLSGVCRILAKNLRHSRGGLPDLVVWSSHSLQYKLVEVKGPSDRLSHKQTVWLDQLRRLGADAEVCHVSAVGARSHRLS
uniref:fanconi-associated nuclease 1 n=1 Tax=Pristiophorus japonicus TaxID=55135 RepID=UPI00398F5816